MSYRPKKTCTRAPSRFYFKAASSPARNSTAGHAQPPQQRASTIPRWRVSSTSPMHLPRSRPAAPAPPTPKSSLRIPGQIRPQGNRPLFPSSKKWTSTSSSRASPAQWPLDEGGTSLLRPPTMGDDWKEYLRPLSARLNNSPRQPPRHRVCATHLKSG